MFVPSLGGRAWRRVGRGRYVTTVRMPWGVDEAAEIIVGTRGGWLDRTEARDPRWTAYPIGPAMLAIRLLGGSPVAGRRRRVSGCSAVTV